MLIDFGHGSKELVFSVLTCVIYEQEFGTDMIQDFFNRIDIKREQEDEDIIVSLDFTQTPWTAYMKVIWAGMKAADDSTPPFMVWAKETTELELLETKEELVAAVGRLLHPNSEEDTEDSE